MTAGVSAWIAAISAIISGLAAFVSVREARKARESAGREVAIKEAWDAVHTLYAQVQELMKANRATGSGAGSALRAEFHAAHDNLTRLLKEAGRPAHGAPPRLDWPDQRR